MTASSAAAVTVVSMVLAEEIKVFWESELVACYIVVASVSHLAFLACKYLSSTCFIWIWAPTVMKTFYCCWEAVLLSGTLVPPMVLRMEDVVAAAVPNGVS